MLRSAAILLLSLISAAAQSSTDTFLENHNRGEQYIRKGDLNAAVPWLRRAYTIRPDNYDNAWDLATACLQIKRIDEARLVVERLLKREDRSELHNLLGDIEEASGHTVEAVKQYETAARSDPTEKNVFDLATELLNHSGFSQAVQIFEFGTGKYPSSARLRMGLGIAYYSIGRYREAVETLCKAVDLDPHDNRGLDFLGKMVDVSPEMAEDVRQRLARFVELYPDSAAANYYYALSLQAAGNSAKMETLLLKSVELDPRFADAHFHLGVLYQQESKPAKAIREFEAAVKLRPEIKAAHYRLSGLYQAQGLHEQARRELEIFRSLPANSAAK
jgi:tetratricopeptide (TPR) repeat protein